MKVRYVVEKLNQNGSTESTTSELSGSEILIGRGGNSAITLTGRTVSLEHAKLLFKEGRLLIEDCNSLTGIRVNGKRVMRSELESGDSFQVGSTKFKLVGIQGDELELVRLAEVEVAVAEEEIVAQQLRALSLRRYIPPMRYLSLITFSVVALFYFVLPLVGTRAQSWSSGPISNSHKMIEGDCSSCHSKSFVQVEDSDCLKCHSMTEHAKDLAKLVADRPEHNLRCAQCHMEHNGDGALVQTDPRVCSGCHTEISAIKNDSKLLNIPSFDAHPQFQVDVKQGDGSVARVSLDDKSNLKDSAQLKLNHALHLKAGLRGKDGPVQLSCGSCHELSEDRQLIKPISFESHCQDCHSLGFDSRLPDTQVPHGDDEAVYPTLFTEYTKLLLMGGAVAKPRTGAEDKFAREIPPGTSGVVRSQKLTDKELAVVTSEARSAERELFTKTACYLCHSVAEKPSSERTATNTHYRVSDPAVPSTWLTKSIFDHGAHEEVSCESCHEGVRKSSETTDVLLPGVKSCQECHSQGVKHGYVKSDCTMCHSYHDSLGFPADKKKSIADYISLVQR